VLVAGESGGHLTLPGARRGDVVAKEQEPSGAVTIAKSADGLYIHGRNRKPLEGLSPSWMCRRRHGAGVVSAPHDAEV
jgi:hypothetical protein